MKKRMSSQKVRDIQRFILLGQHRTGSTLLTLALRDHPNIRMWGELLYAQPDLDGPEYLRPEVSGDKYLNNQIFGRKYDDVIRAVGFKAFYVHARDNSASSRAWDFLISNSDIAVIQLIRANLLAQFVSFERAMQNGIWHEPIKENIKKSVPRKIYLEPVACETYFRKELNYRDWAIKEFRDHKFMTVEYEKDICGDFAETYNKVLKFLGMPPYTPIKHLSKMGVLPLRNYILNYDELCKYFKHTQYECFFEDSY